MVTVLCAVFQVADSDYSLFLDVWVALMPFGVRYDLATDSFACLID